MNRVVRADAEYTGGGIYVYIGKLSSGEYFYTADEYEGIVWILDIDPAEHFDETQDVEWLEEHSTREVNTRVGFDIWRQILDKVEMIDCDWLRRDRQLKAEIVANEMDLSRPQKDEIKIDTYNVGDWFVYIHDDGKEWMAYLQKKGNGIISLMFGQEANANGLDKDGFLNVVIANLAEDISIYLEEFDD